MVYCSTSLLTSLVFSSNARILLVICCAAATASARPHDRSLSQCPPGLEHFPKIVYPYLVLGSDFPVVLLTDAFSYLFFFFFFNLSVLILLPLLFYAIS